MSSQASTGPLVDALRKKCNHQAERIDELEETVDELEARLRSVELALAEREGDA